MDRRRVLRATLATSAGVSGATGGTAAAWCAVAVDGPAAAPLDSASALTLGTSAAVEGVAVDGGTSAADSMTEDRRGCLGGFFTVATAGGTAAAAAGTAAAAAALAPFRPDGKNDGPGVSSPGQGKQRNRHSATGR